MIGSELREELREARVRIEAAVAAGQLLSSLSGVLDFARQLE